MRIKLQVKLGDGAGEERGLTPSLTAESPGGDSISR